MSQEPNHIDAAIADLEGWLGRISTAIETLRALRVQGGTLPGGPPPADISRTDTNGDISHDAFFQMTVPDAAEKYLAIVKKTKPTAEIAGALLKGGLKSTAKRFPAMVNTVLSREDRFAKVHGEWGLSVWYPGMRRGPRAVPGDAAGHPNEPSSEERPKREPSTEGFSPESMRGRALQLLDSRPNEQFDAPKVAQHLNAKNRPSVSAALSDLLAAGLIQRAERGKYKSKKSA
jgi:hypothetical protein